MDQLEGIKPFDENWGEDTPGDEFDEVGIQRIHMFLITDMYNSYIFRGLIHHVFGALTEYIQGLPSHGSTHYCPCSTPSPPHSSNSNSN